MKTERKWLCPACGKENTNWLKTYYSRHSKILEAKGVYISFCPGCRKPLLLEESKPEKSRLVCLEDE